ncbi:MAG: 1-deoxy-D-xylulose-5-phosphate synthase [Planctomycetes bacterium]|nr:1-deoxy-D-xylulose-5-phosphate synthase [Planctomycetota bacterium]
MSHDSSKVLGRISGPGDLKQLSPADRVQLAREIRERICRVVSRNGGHFGSNMGVVELTIALHTVFESPLDKIVWDVSHQCYPHKLLTGRGEVFDSLRTYEGMSGFCHKDESEHDTAYAGHAGTATSIALGIASGRAALGADRHVVSVVGDASIVTGMTLEALNHAGWIGERMIVVLNDNGMSISYPVGGLHKALTAVRGTGTPESNPYRPRGPQDLSPDLAGLDVGGFFERLGLDYVGPVDGHDTEALIAALEQVKGRGGPTLLHVHTRKGHGWEPAIEDPITWHAAKGFWREPDDDRAQAAPLAPNAPRRPSWTQAFSRALIDAAGEDPRVVAITAAMPGGTGLDAFDKQFPDRCYDVGICEQHATGFASGLRLAGLKPVLAIYSTFLQRGYDQVVHDLAIQGNPAVLAMDRGGLVGDDGVTHQGLFDIAYLRCIPDLVLASPQDEPELRAMLRWALRGERIVGLRWPRDTVPEPLEREAPPIELGKGRVVRGGEGDAAFFAYGAMVQHALEASHLLSHRGLATSVVNARFAKPIDVELLVQQLERHEVVITVEDHAEEGGFGSACAQAVLARRPDLVGRLRIAGVPDQFVHHGARPLQLRDAGLDAAGLALRVETALRASAPARLRSVALLSSPAG